MAKRKEEKCGNVSKKEQIMWCVRLSVIRDGFREIPVKNFSNILTKKGALRLIQRLTSGTINPTIMRTGLNRKLYLVVVSPKR